MKELAYLVAGLIVGAALIISIAAKPIENQNDSGYDSWAEQARADCNEKHGYLIPQFYTRAQRAAHQDVGVLCVPVIFQKDKP